MPFNTPSFNATAKVYQDHHDKFRLFVDNVVAAYTPGKVFSYTVEDRGLELRVGFCGHTVAMRLSFVWQHGGGPVCQIQSYYIDLEGKYVTRPLNVSLDALGNVAGNGVQFSVQNDSPKILYYLIG